MIFNMSGGGGGTALNFKVVGGTEQPENPSENTIWVNTDVDIIGWVFSALADEPDTEEGLLWITIGVASSVKFNALNKNTVNVYPVKAKQAVDGAWVEKDAMIFYQDAWHELLTYVQSIEISGLTDEKKVKAYPAWPATLADKLALSEETAKVRACRRSGSVMNFECWEGVPTLDIPIVVEVYV